MFEHIEIDFPSLSRQTIDGVRYYDTPDGKKLVSITSIISHYQREIFREWRAKVGNDEANKITKQATSRGTDMHTLSENYLSNKKLPSVQPLSEFLFKLSKLARVCHHYLRLLHSLLTIAKGKLFFQLQRLFVPRAC